MGKRSRTKKISKKRIICVVLIILAIVLIVLFANESSIISTNAQDINYNLGITDEGTAESWDTSKISEYIVDKSMTDEDGNTITMYVPIPTGFTASQATGETTVKEGLVIYEGDEVVTDSNVTTAKLTKNQWVWVPVDSSNVYWTNTSGQNYGKYYSFTVSGATSSNPSYEPLLKSNFTDYDYIAQKYNSDYDTALELEKEMQVDFDEMVESIEKYGGFYIGRYEIGTTATSRSSSETASTTYNTTETAVLMKQKYVYNLLDWYEAYDLCKSFTIDNNDAYETQMIWGTLWDNTLLYLVQSGDKEYSELTYSSSVEGSGSGSWGNFNDQSFDYYKINSTENTATKNSGTGTLIPTGSGIDENGNDRNISCNIYDLAGNVWEWTAEAVSASSTGRRGRGGSCDDASTEYWASYRFSVNVSYRYINIRFASCAFAKVALIPECTKLVACRQRKMGRKFETGNLRQKI